MKLFRASVAALGALALAATAASAASREDTVLDAVTGKDIAGLMTEFGYDVDMEEDDQGDPYLVSSKDGTNFVVIFYGCDNSRHPYKRVCGDIQFRSGYEAPDAASLERMNKWNHEFRFGKAYIDSEGDPTIEMIVNMSGGVTRAYVRNTLKWWTIVLRDFEDHIGWRDSAGDDPARETGSGSTL